MKKAFFFIMIITMTSQSFASNFEYDYSYATILKKLKACRTTLEGCTSEEELEIASFTGNILSSNELDKQLSKDSQRSIYIPLDLNNNELLTLAAATSLGVVAFKNDQDIMDVIQNHKSDVTEKITNVGNFLGTAKFGLTIAAGSYFMGICFENNKLKRVGLFVVGANLATSIVTGATKTAFGRARPNKDIGPYSFFNWPDKSFYSGHTAQAFSIATVISEMYKEEYPIVPYVAYGVAAITGYARMHKKAHWASDVIIGAVAGHLVTKLAMKYMDAHDGSNGLEIYPGINPETGEFMIFLEWTGKEPYVPLKCTKMPEGFKKTEACLEEAFERAKK